MKTPHVVLRKLMIGVAVMAAVTQFPPAAAGTTYHVKGACGNDAWSGTAPGCTPPNGPKATIQAAIDAAIAGDEILVWPYTYDERIDFLGKAVALRSQAGPQATVIDGGGAGTVVTCSSGEGPATVVEGFTITGGRATLGGGMYNVGSSPTVRDCIFTGNEAEVGGGMRNQFDSSPFVDRCSFIDNVGDPAGGAMVNSEGQPVVRNCLFLHNNAEAGGAVINLDTSAGPPTFVNCQFLQNDSRVAYGTVLDGGGATWVNCVFSRNIATASPLGDLGALDLVAGQPLVVNCTFSGNIGAGLTNTTVAILTVRNSIVWGNSVASIQGTASVAYSDIQGGWPGTGNIDADPMFAQPGTDNVRLSVGSPCLNAGSNAALPSDELDLDGDGDTSEPLPVDLDNYPRVQGGTVDMGGYEGAFDQESPAAGESDLDQGEFVILSPTSGDPDPLQSALVFVANTSGPDDATFVVTEYEGDIHPGAEGYSELSCILSNETSLADGQWRSTQIIPFDADDLGPMSPAEINLTRYDPETGNWSLAVTGNTVDSPGCDGPVGDRVVVLEGGDWGLTNDLGDYGVYWDPAVGQGFAWAKVDAAADFGLGVALCPADCRQTPDGVVGSVDFLALLSRWGEVSLGGPCDINFDGVVEKGDFFALLMAWGPCSPAAPGGGSSGRQVPGPVQADLAVLRASWGRCAGDCPADLDGDGVVGVKDLLAVLANWR